jgi:DUF438 domain-containing protein
VSCGAFNLEGAVEKMKALPSGHVIRVMFEEHDCLLNSLSDLEKFNHQVQSLSSWDDAAKRREDLLALAQTFLDAEPHHQREEQVLFPRIEEKGIAGPPMVMRHEHEELRIRKKSLKELAEKSDMDFKAFQETLNTLSSYLTGVLREHIQKENGILYPMALEIIADDAVWKQMKEACDAIGYCSFTPKEH